MIPDAQTSALRRAISPDRLGTYEAAATRTGCDVLDLYVWDRDLAAAILADIAVLEVALRNAIHTQLTNTYGGPEWCTRPIGLDERSQRDLATAWNRLRAAQRTPGRVVAQLTLGFWVGLLGAGGYTARPPQGIKCDYEVLWREALRNAFPGGRNQAEAANTQFTRSRVSSTVTIVHALRNRVSHHEPLVDSFPLPG